MNRGMSGPQGQEKDFFFSRNSQPILWGTQRTWILPTENLRLSTRTSNLKGPKDFGKNSIQKEEEG